MSSLNYSSLANEEGVGCLEKESFRMKKEEEAAVIVKEEKELLMNNYQRERPNQDAGLSGIKYSKKAVH
jgi:hypothetical protein